MKKENLSFPQNTLIQAELVKNGWKELMDKFEVPNLTLKEFEQKIQLALEKTELAEKLKKERSEAVKNRNQYLKEVWDFTKRIKNSAKATFGDNSRNMEKFGGKPIKNKS